MSNIRSRLVRQIWRGKDPFEGFSADPALVDLQGWAGSHHHWFQELILSMRPQIVVEIGVWKGSSCIHIAEFLKRDGIDGIVIAIDTWLGSAEHWLNEQWFTSLNLKSGRPQLQEQFFNNVLSHDLANFVLPIPLDSASAAHLLSVLGVYPDLIHVDAGHDLQSVAADLALWWPLLKEGGVLVGDDYYHDGSLWPEVKAGFANFVAERRLQFEHTPGKIRITKPAEGFPEPRLTEPKHDMLNPPNIIECTGEFGSELVLFLPYCEWLDQFGLLKDRRIKTYHGMKCFYDHLRSAEIVEKRAKREYLPPADRPRFLPARDEHCLRRGTLGHSYPDLRAKFGRCAFPVLHTKIEKPLLIVHNKFADEWGAGPVNFLPLVSLRTLFTLYQNDYSIIYIRHKRHQNICDGFSRDHSENRYLQDDTLLDDYPAVIDFEALFDDHQQCGGSYDLNTFKNVLYSRCFAFLSSQGGGTHHIAYFSGSVMVIMHRFGEESRISYQNGYYNFLSNPSPIRAICHNNSDLERSFILFAGLRIVDGRAMLSSGALSVAAELSPWRKRARQEKKGSSALFDPQRCVPIDWFAVDPSDGDRYLVARTPSARLHLVAREPGLYRVEFVLRAVNTGVKVRININKQTYYHGGLNGTELSLIELISELHPTLNAVDFEVRENSISANSALELRSCSLIKQP